MRGGGDGCAWTRASLAGAVPMATREGELSRQTPNRRTSDWPLNQWRAGCAVDPPRSIPNRVVKRSGAEGTGGLTAGRLDPCAIPIAAWSSGSSSGS